MTDMHTILQIRWISEKVMPLLKLLAVSNFSFLYQFLIPFCFLLISSNIIAKEKGEGGLKKETSEWMTMTNVPTLFKTCFEL